MLERFASVLERRFLLVAFLPTLIFGVGLSAVAIVANRSGSAVLTWWNGQPAATQLVVVLGVLAVTWLVAGFLDSQLRNLTQLFEGYVLQSVLPRTAARATAWHRRRASAASAVQIVALPPALANSPGDAPASGPGSAPASPADGKAAEFAEEAFVLYPRDPNDVLPTRLGNVIRAAEEYAKDRYNADYLLVWPRLAHLCTERFVQDYEAVRASLDFLLVVAALTGTFSLLSGAIILVESGPVLLFVACVLGGCAVANLAYSSAVAAAVEYGEQIRASMDLYRLDLLQQLRFPSPTSRGQEADYWKEFEATLKRGHPRTTPYTSAPAPE